MTKESVSLGWIQDAAKLTNLHTCANVFVHGSNANSNTIQAIKNLVRDSILQARFINELSTEQIVVPICDLKGRKVRGNDSCSGIFQAAIHGQGRAYIGDWPADNYARLAISLGILEYNRADATCRITDFGRKFASTMPDTKEWKEILPQLLGANPPVRRILSILDIEQPMTKFEIAKKLTVLDENGFGSVVNDRYILELLSECDDKKSEKSLLSNIECTSDKYVRTICAWLIEAGYVRKQSVKISDNINGNNISVTINQAYVATARGKEALKRMNGNSKHPAVPLIVFREMLAMGARNPERDYLRIRRARILESVRRGADINKICESLERYGIHDEPEATIIDDIEILNAMGIPITKSSSGIYHCNLKIAGLDVPANVNTSNNEIAKWIVETKKRIRPLLTHIPKEYISLLDMSCIDTRNSNAAFEALTASLLKYVGFSGKHLGGSRKPDNCFYNGNIGVIIDNKAYGTGFSLDRHQADEMERYIREVQKRDSSIAPNCWWKVFPSDVTNIGYLFVSSKFVGGFKDRINYITKDTGMHGGCIGVASLLLICNDILAGKITQQEALTALRNDCEYIDSRISC